MKIRKLLRLSFLSLVLVLGSCVSDSTVNSDTTLSSDAEIKSFSLAANTNVTTNLDKVFFTIDQQNNLIYNADSIAFDSKIKNPLNLLTNITFAAASKVMIKLEDGTSKTYQTTDSISYTKPFSIEVTAVDGNTTKSYKVQLNIHKQNPNYLDSRALSFDGWNSTIFDSNKTVAFKNEFLNFLKTSSGILLFKTSTNDGLHWVLNSHNLPLTAQIETVTAFGNNLYIVTSDKDLYTSADGAVWSKASSSTGFSGIIGTLTDQDGIKRLIAIMTNDNNSYHLAASTDGITFATYGDAVLPLDFPLSGFASLLKTIGITEKLTIVGGKDKAGNLLNSVQQMYWDKSGFHCGYNIENNGNWFTAREGGIAYNYDNKMVFACGKNQTHTYKDIYTSKNNGITWQKDTVNIFPSSFVTRANASAIVDMNNFIWIFGGVKDGTSLNEIWKGRFNRYGFIRQ